MADLSASQPVRVRPGWTVPALVIGVALLAGGGWAVHHTWTMGDLCAVVPQAEGCSRTVLEQDAGGLALLTGLVLTLVGGAFGLRRARVAARSAAPWVIHRQLSGRWSGLTVGRAAIAGAALTVLAATSAHAAWSRLDHHRRVAAYRQAEQSLPRLRLPAALQPVTSGAAGCQTSSNRRCATSTLPPAQLAPALGRLVRGHEVGTALSDIGCPAQHCPVVVQGTLRGSRVLIFAFWHLVGPTTEAVPAGASAVKSWASHVSWAGSDVQIELVDPDAPA